MEETKVMVGSRLSKYLLLEEIAAGGMATVYFGVDTTSESHVAIKRIHPHLANETSIAEMFRDEAKISIRLEHPNICATLDFDVDPSGAPYLVLEYLHGVSLSTLLAAGGCTPAMAAYIVARAARGLHHAHEMTDDHGQPLQVIHRDVSPQNIMVCRDGRVKVVDFGIAKAEQREHETRNGALKGKLSYMAPEQMRSKTPPDRRVDVWALGVVLWEALTGERLFRRSTNFESMFAILEDPIAPPSTDPELARIVARALERDPAQRYPTAKALAADLDAWLGAAMDQPALAAWMATTHPELDRSTAYLGSGTGALAPTEVTSSGMQFDVGHGPGFVAISIVGRMTSVDDARAYQARIERELRDRSARALVMDNRRGTGASAEAYSCMWEWIQSRGSGLFDQLAFVVESPSLIRGINATGVEYGVNTRAFADYGQAIRWLVPATEVPATETNLGR